MDNRSKKTLNVHKAKKFCNGKYLKQSRWTWDIKDLLRSAAFSVHSETASTFDIGIHSPRSHPDSLLGTCEERFSGKLYWIREAGQILEGVVSHASFEKRQSP